MALIGTREKIVDAAAEIIRDGERPSVRTVAARAGVGASTLRHYFPTQRSLLDATISELYTEAMPDARIRDTSVPARERLLECLGALLEPFNTEEQARLTWRTVYESFIAPEATDQAREGYLVLVGQAQRRVESWLAILESEGAVAPGDTAERSRFLMAVVDGVSLDRAMLPRPARLEFEASTLRFAVDAVFNAK
ncbi:TetR/AcrR family transcriptional regulator [Microbacterium yannicii]|uniref:TetR/AcrR family transcriptional regulator n=1 Tax=Microbacterium yannicii TaxID=671622 RepID=UPI00031F9D6C|nr:TetR/AcrR family transcriptional regulator [Microbacterium yannicii]